MNDFAWNPEMGKYKYFYKMKVTSRTGREYWRYYPWRWKDGPIISRVKMHPEQAVLTCCQVAGYQTKIYEYTPPCNNCSSYGPCYEPGTLEATNS